MQKQRLKKTNSCILCAIFLWCTVQFLAACKNAKIGAEPRRVPQSQPGSTFLLKAKCTFGTSTLAPPTGPGCEVAAGSSLRVQQAAIIGGFFKLTLLEPFPQCNFQEGYIPTTCGSIVSGPLVSVVPAAANAKPNSPTAKVTTVPVDKGNTQITPEKAFLNLIAFAEGTRGKGNDGYNIIYSGKTFSSYKDHPRKIICSNYCSDAAGRYQFLAKTWDGVKRTNSLSSFEPKNQDTGGLYLVRQRGVKTHTSRLAYAPFREAILKLGKEWASFPGSPYGQPVKTVKDMWDFYDGEFK